MLQKVYFPRLVLPVAAAIATFVDLVVASVVLGALMGWYGIAAHGWSLLAVPAFLVLAVAVALTVGIALSAINVRYRDVAYALPFLLQLWLFATPIAYPASILHEPWRTIYGLNPMAGVVEGIRWALLGTPAPGPIVFVSVGITAVGLFAAVTYFARTQRLLADVV
jgi:lipopolysaccharide transport system permease protein